MSTDFGTGNDIFVTVDTTPVTVAGTAGMAYAVELISGEFEGLTITGLYGPSATYTDNGVIDFDNAVFTSDSGGVTLDGNSGSYFGLDIAGLAFTTSDGITDNLYTVGTTFEYYTYTGAQGTLTLVSSDAPCYVSGTRLLTERSEVAVENIAPGDRAITLADGVEVAQPVIWVGQRRVDLASHPRPELVAPIRIRHGAFGDGLPHRDLLVSPDHAVFIDGRLVCARMLVNGMTVTQEFETRSVTYYHIELARHALLLAEGLPAESYLDTGNRSMFTNGGQPVTLYPDFGVTQRLVAREKGGCAPLATALEEVRPLWQRLATRAESLGYSPRIPTTTDDPDLHVDACGRYVRPVAVERDRYIFVLPRGTRTIQLVSRAWVPSDLTPYVDDRRRLGIYVNRLVFRAGDDYVDLPMDHPALSDGWHAIERAGRAMHRWTDGRASLPVPLDPGTGPVTLQVCVSGKGIYQLDRANVAVSPLAA